MAYDNNDSNKDSVPTLLHPTPHAHARADHVPTVTNLRPQTFDLRLSLDTTGYAYAVVVPTSATARRRESVPHPQLFS